MRIRRLFSILAPLALVASLAAAQSPALIPVGGEILVNTTTAEYQSSPDVAMDGAGNFVVVWMGGPFVGNREIFAQRYEASGTPLGSEFRVNTFTSTAQTNPRVGMDADGDFVVVWSSQNQFPPALSSVIGQRYDKTGAPVGGEFHISTGLTTISPDVAMGANGDFLVAWGGRPENTFESANVYARLYDSTGTVSTSAFVINAVPYTPFSVQRPSVMAAPDGSWVVAWTGPAAVGIDVLARRLDADGNPAGSEVVVQVSANAPRQDAGIAASSDRIVVSWTDNASNRSVHARLFDGGFAPLSGDLPISTLTGVRIQEPVCAMDGSGSFVVSWTETDQTIPSRDGSGSTVLARAFDPDGNPVGAEIVVNTTASGSQSSSRLAMSSDGRLAIVWRGERPGDQSDIFVQLYGTPATVLTDLIAFIESLGLGGVGDALIAKLEAAAASLEAGTTAAAINQLNAFQNQVEAQAGKKITTADAELLQQAVDDLIAALEG